MSGAFKFQPKKLVKAARKPTTRFVLGLAILFILSGNIQHWFVRRQVYATAKSELDAWAEKIDREIAYQDSWSLKGYRNAGIDAPNWYVVTSKGLVVDIEGSIPGLLPPVTPPDELIYGESQTVVSEIGERWRLFRKKLEGGMVILGILDPDDVNLPDDRLRTNAAKFGTTLDEALRLGSREVDFAVDYVVIADSGEIRSAWGGIPLRVDPAWVSRLSEMEAPMLIGGKFYRVATRAILDSSGSPVGTVIIPKDVTLEQRAIREQVLFNLVVGAALFAAAVFAGIYFIGREVMRRCRHVSVEEGRRLGEGQHIEYKRSLQWDFGQGCRNTTVSLASLKTIAAFLNSGGGTLLIGVRDDATICGIKEDLALFSGSRDKFQLHLRDLITGKIGSEFAQFASERLEEVDGQPICVVEVDGAAAPAFVRWDGTDHYYIREGPKTSDLNPKQALAHAQNNSWFQ